jgi:hypothetical protein
MFHLENQAFFEQKKFLSTLEHIEFGEFYLNLAGHIRFSCYDKEAFKQAVLHLKTCDPNRIENYTAFLLDLCEHYSKSFGLFKNYSTLNRLKLIFCLGEFNDYWYRS